MEPVVLAPLGEPLFIFVQYISFLVALPSLLRPLHMHFGGPLDQLDGEASTGHAVSRISYPSS